MKNFWKLYLRGRLPTLVLFALCCTVFGATFYLYGFPLGAVAYPALICAMLWLVYATLAMRRAWRKHVL